MPVTRLITALGAGLLLAILVTPTARAGDGGGAGGSRDDSPPASHAGNNVSGAAGITVQQDGQSVPVGGGNLDHTVDYRPPPPCWYEPFTTAQEFPTTIDNIWFSWIHDPDSNRGEASTFKKHYLSENQAHLDSGDKGLWYIENCADDASPAAADWLARHPELFLWVAQGQDPPAAAGDVLTPRMLAEHARDSAVLPDTKLEFNPTKPVVNLPTWTWLDPGTYKPVHLVASVAPIGGAAGMTVQVDVTPARIELPTDLPDAMPTPGDGVCTQVNAAYHAGEHSAMRCGITFGRSSARQPDQRYQVHAEVAWKIHWTSNNGAGDLDDARLGGDTPIAVREIQTVVTHAG